MGSALVLQPQLGLLKVEYATTDLLHASVPENSGAQKRLSLQKAAKIHHTQDYKDNIKQKSMQN